MEYIHSEYTNKQNTIQFKRKQKLLSQGEITRVREEKISLNPLYGLAKVSGQFLIAWSLSGQTSKAHR